MEQATDEKKWRLGKLRLAEWVGAWRMLLLILVRNTRPLERKQHAERCYEDQRVLSGVRLRLAERNLDPASFHPALRHLRCAHLSDVHLGWSTPQAQVRHAVEVINRAGVGITFMTGDFFALPSRSSERSLQALAGIRGAVFAVLGNHDRGKRASTIGHVLRDHGYTVLRDQLADVGINGDRLTVVGLDGSHRDIESQRRLLSEIPSEQGVVVLCHDPTRFRILPEDRGWLCLSGHTHGGHFVIPGVTVPLFRLFGQPWIAGEFHRSGNVLHVSRGAGCSRRLAGRVGAHPELTILTM